MHILILPSWYKTPQNSVTGTFFEEQARMFLKKGHQVGVLYARHELRFMGITRFRLEKTPTFLVDKGIPTYYSFTESVIPKVPYPTRIDLMIFKKKAIWAYREYVKKNGKPDVLHAHSTLWGGIVADYIAQVEKLPFFLTEHFSGWILNNTYKQFQVYANLLNQVVCRSEKTFIVSNYFKDRLVELYKLDVNELNVLPNVVSFIFSEGKGPIELFEPIQLIMVGYLKPIKNHELIFDALKVLKNRGINISLKIIGSGPLESKLRNYVKTVDLEDEIHFLGLLERQEVLNQIRRAHILISVSKFETFGVNIIEALAVGRPVVVYDSGGPRDIVRPKDGILFQENTPTAVANAIEYVIKNYPSFDQTQIAKDCIERFGEEIIYQKSLKFYNKAI